MSRNSWRTSGVQPGAVQSLAVLTTGERIENAFVSYARYLGKTFWPEKLSVLYPHPLHWPWLQVLPAAALVGALCLAVLAWQRRLPFLVTGWFWFLGTLIPVIGLVQVGNQSIADRYTYLPLIGVFILLAWGVGEVCSRWPKSRTSRAVAGMAAGLAITACAAGVRRELPHWYDSESLFRHAIAVTDRNYLAHNNLGLALYHEGKTDPAMAQYEESLEIQPDYALAQNNLGAVLREKGQADAAIAHFQKALAAEPDFAEAHYNLGNALFARGQLDAAIRHYRKAAELEPDQLGP